jgi:hypothetical protein
LIRPVESPSSPEVAKQAPAPPPARPTAGKDFAAVHAAAMAKTSEPSGTGGTAAASEPAAAAATSAATHRTYPHYPRIPQGETWAAVKPGAHYARILTGPRAGQYINLTHNGALRNHTFTIEQSSGRTFHVYGSGENKVMVDAAADHGQVTAADKAVKGRSDQAKAGEVWEPVRGHRYADIIGGPRNGLFVNTQGGPRDGMSFQIVKRDGKVFHVYGTGKDREVIQVDGPRANPTTTKAAQASAAAGGSAPPADAQNAGAKTGTSQEAASDRVAAIRPRIAMPPASGNGEAASVAASGQPSLDSAGAPPIADLAALSASDGAAPALWNVAPILGALVDPAADSRARPRSDDESGDAA